MSSHRLGRLSNLRALFAILWPIGASHHDRNQTVPLILAVTLVGHASTAQPSRGVSVKTGVVFVGSSSVNDSFGHLVASDLRDSGYEVVRKGYSAAGFARPDFVDLHAKVSELPIDGSTEAVLVYFGGNDAQALWLYPEERVGRGTWIKWDEVGWSEVYQNRTQTFIDALCQEGARQVIVLPPVDVASPRMQRRLERIRELQQRAADSSACGTFVSTSGDVGQLAPNGAPLRAADGVHMTRAGAVRVWLRVVPQVLRLIGS